MFDTKTSAVSLLLFILFEGVTSLRDVQLVVTPATVIRGGTATFACLRDMQKNESIYSVKWYRGNYEFYQYVPNEIPQGKVFFIPGIYVNTKKSNGSQVVLKNMDINLSGNFSCEVTAETNFITKIATKFVEVVALPSSDPVLKSDKDRYEVGEILRANCTSAPARPAANLTIYINDEPYRSSETSLYTTDNGLQWATVHVELRVTAELFPLGRLRVTCLAALYDVYNAAAKLDFFTPDADPVPERIMLSGSPMNKFHNWMLLLFLLFLPSVLGQDYGIFEDVFDGNFYDDAHSESAAMSLVGG